MRQQHSTEESGLTLTDPPATDGSGNNTADRITLQDKNVYILEELNKSAAVGNDNNDSSPHSNIEAQSAYDAIPALRQRRIIIFAGIGIILAVSVIILQVIFFTHLASLIPDDTSFATETIPISAGIASQINTAVDSQENKSIEPDPIESPATAVNKYVDNSVNGIVTPAQSGDEKSDQPREDLSITTGEIAPADILTGSRSGTATAVASIPHEVVPDTDTKATFLYAREDGTEEIQIIHNRIPDRTGELIKSAYAAYVAGNYNDARQAYLGILRDMPDNRNALLGMAAIAQRAEGPDQGARIWMQVLAKYPGDPVATAALINLMANQDYTGSTRTIGKLLQEYPHAAFLYFSLGNLHASAFRWPEAQRAFAEASRLEGDNPDYAYNLAVTLEHVGDHRGALGYYKTAADLAQNKPVNFDISVVMSRITALSENTRAR
jgi:tetratricopeptide (TPR) repeat protein